MATKTIPKTSDRKTQEVALTEHLQRIIDSQDQAAIEAAGSFLGLIVRKLKPRKGGVA